MEFVSWNPIRMIRRYRERRQRLQREGRRGIVWNPMEIIRRRRERRRTRQEEELTVRISNPRLRIRGVIKKMRNYPRLEYLAFPGIPYAKPPVDELRFQPPERLCQVPPGERTPPLEPNDGSHPCAQLDGNEVKGSEDCLYLNVYIPEKTKDIRELLPVLVYIHGGGFSGGDNATIDPDDIMRKDLILVVPNYRLNIFGFLNMRSKNCRGNAGLKDQVMALEWVRDNIEAFKGNPENVTICGQSAGATCVNLHMLSPLSKGLFHKAIVMAGGVYCPWGFGGHAKHVKHLFKKAARQTNELRNVVVDSLKKEKTFDLLKLGKGTMAEYIALTPRKMTAYFKPSVEYIEEDAFLSDTVENLMAIAEPVPTIAGITKQEGYQYFRVHKSAVRKLMKKKIKFVELLKEFIQQNFSWKDPDAVERRFEFFKTMYFPGDATLDEGENVNEEDETLMTDEEKLRREEEQQQKDEERKQRLATLVTDIYFRRFYDHFKIGNLLNEGEPPFYVYEFDYFAGQSIFPMPKLEEHCYDSQPLITPTAAEHGDDVIFLLGPEHLDNVLSYTADEHYSDLLEIEIERVKSNMRNLWSSFCSTGVPKGGPMAGGAHIKWLRHTEENPRYLHIGKTLTLRHTRLNEERWSELNRICQLESTISSLAVTPQTPDKEFKMLQLLQSEPGPSTTQAPDTRCACKVSQLSQPKPDDQQSTSQTSVEETEYECTRL